MAESGNKSLRIPRSGPDAPRKGGINHLFIVGIDNYSSVAKLNNAVRDAHAVRDVLLEYYEFDKSRLTELYNEQATRQNIMQALRKMASELKDEDNVILYFSGHGHYDTVLDEGYWVPVGASYDIIDDYISYSFIQKVVKAAQARHILLIVDSCYSGAVLVRERDAVKDRLERDPSRWLIASGRNEVVPDGRVGEHSPFAEELIYLLKNYNQSSLSTMQLVDRLTSNVIYNSRQTPIGQPLFDVGHRGGQFFFHPKKGTMGLTPPQAPVVEEVVEEKPVPPPPKSKPKPRTGTKKKTPTKTPPPKAKPPSKQSPTQKTTPIHSDSSRAPGGKIVAGIIALAVIIFIIWAIIPSEPDNPARERQRVTWKKIQVEAEAAMKERDLDKLYKVGAIYYQTFSPGEEPAGGKELMDRVKKMQNTLKKDAENKQPNVIEVPRTLKPNTKLVSPDELTRAAYLKSYKNIRITDYLNLLSTGAVAKNKAEVQKALLNANDLGTGSINNLTKVKFRLYVDETGRTRGHKMIEPVISENSLLGSIYKNVETKIGENYLYKLVYTPAKNKQGRFAKSMVDETFTLK
jgi:hypothetical protein